MGDQGCGIRVAIYGGGVGGLSAAHELAKLGDRFDVHVYEAGDFVGGKARSQYLHNTGFGGRADLPGEHGFRFFPGFYYHLDQTMREIPCDHGGSVLDNLVGSERFAVARRGRSPVFARRRIGRGMHGVGDATDTVRTWLSDGILDLQPADVGNLVYSITKFLLSAETRRRRQYDFQSWYDFTNCSSARLSENYRSLACSLPRTMVAMDGRNGSAYTLGKVCAQLFFLDPLRRDSELDRVLNAPTDESWLRPWYRHLCSSGVTFHFGERLERVVLSDDGTRVVEATLRSGKRVIAEHHVCALPMEKMVGIVDDDLASASSSLRALRAHLFDQTAWMAGAQYFLGRRMPIVDGHVAYIDSPWALTSVSQQQFWRHSGREMSSAYGDGRVRDVLSVDISNWDAVAPRVGRPARQCTREEILDETFRQLQDGLNGGSAIALRSSDVVTRHLDNNIEFASPTGRVSGNKTPLLVHAPGTYQFRPGAGTEVSNLFLASDYVATHTNLATMEGANEAARRAVGRILHQVGQPDASPVVRDIQEPTVFAPFRRLDDWMMTKAPSVDHAVSLDETELSEVVAAAAREQSGVSIRELTRSLGAFPRRPAGLNPKGASRVVSSTRTLSSGLRRAQRLATRRTFPLRVRRSLRASPMVPSLSAAGSPTAPPDQPPTK